MTGARVCANARCNRAKAPCGGKVANMRILAVSSWLPTTQNPGSGLFTVRDIELLQQNHEVTVLQFVDPAKPSDSAVPIPGVKTVQVPYAYQNPRTYLPAARAVAQIMKSNDILHTMAMSSMLPAALARTKAPWVHTEHFSQLVTPTIPATRRALLRGLSLLYRFPTEVVAVGRILADVIDRNRKDPSWIIGNYVRPLPEEISLDSLQSVTPDGPLKMVAVGGVIARKGALEAVETVAELNRRGFDASLTWAGTGELTEAAKSRAQDLGVFEKVSLLGHVSPSDLSSYLAEANLFLLPVESETFGVAIAEGLTHGLPVVTTGVGEHLHFIPPAASRVAENREAKALADAILDLVRDPNLLSREEIVDYAASRFANESRVEAYNKVYAAALAKC